jgi:hypothetical protein
MMDWHFWGRVLLDLGWLCVLFMLFRHFWLDRKTLVDAQSWLKVKGQITRCDWTKQGHSLWPKIEYSYQVADKDITGEYLFLDTAHNNPNSKYARHVAYKVAMAFNEHQEIDVYYNPNDPAQSTLDVAIPVKLNAILILIGACILLQSVIMVLRYLI